MGVNGLMRGINRTVLLPGHLKICYRGAVPRGKPHENAIAKAR
jgi:hypothetical protein